MGSSSSKFRKHLQNGDEYAALQLYYSSSDLRKGLDSNSSYGDTYSHDTPLHYAARHAMKSLLRVFLNELGGNPNKKNARDETALHCVCMVSNARLNYAIQQRRLECLSLVLQWRGATLENGEVERVDLAAQDENKNTALHYGAASGLKKCVELLVSQNAPLFSENTQGQTPCDCAEKCNHREIALYLESKMVFSNEEDGPEEMDIMLDEMEQEEGYSGLRAQDLQEAKDQLLVETSDMLHIPLFTAEALLRNHEWSREMLLESWMEDAVACCEKCGVVPPSGLLEEQPSTSRVNKPIIHLTQLEHDLRTPTHTAPPTNDAICDICACLISTSEEPVLMLCHHQFCRSCWERYLNVKIKEGEAHNITCPGYECDKLVPAEIIETLVSRDMARRYLQFDIKAFVESNPTIKWCPWPGCGRAVKLPETENPLSPALRSMNDMNANADTSHAVDCGNGHMFCWECLGEAHEPASCDNWTQWHQKIAETKPEQMNGTEEETVMAANCLWLVTNSKPCPNCKSPIQKNEGCNHMKCSKCKHDFCWVCLEGWKKHSSATGGYFRCNRYEVVKRVEDTQDQVKSEAETKNKKMQELNRFVHYYTRFKNHENSFKFEEPLLSTAKDKMMVLAKAVTDPETANLETKFVEDAVIQILKARRVLKSSYVYGYYLDETGYKKPIFEFMQTELEECTETLSEMVARPYLRTPRSKIIQTAHLVQRKRHEFVTAIAKGLVPPDTSPTLKKKRKKFSVEVDDDLRKALLASMQDLDPANPWVKDPSGKHTNVSALLDWPEESDESDTEPTMASIASRIVGSLPRSDEDEDDESDDVMPPDIPLPPEPCARAGCDRLRAINPRTEEMHEHCSMKCMRLDRMEKADGDKVEPPVEFFTDYQMDLLRALEMSRLQFLQEMGSLRPGSGDRSPRSPNFSVSRRTSNRDVDPDSERFPRLPADQERSPRIIGDPERSPHLLGDPERSPHLLGDPERSPHILGDPERSPQLSGHHLRCQSSASPHMIETDQSVPSIVLRDPPLGKKGPIRHKVSQPGEVGFDTELQRALRLSQISVHDEEQDLRLAIELSLQEADRATKQDVPLAPGASPGPLSEGSASGTHSDLLPQDQPGTKSPSGDTHSPFSTEYSTIVTRVPNKSIEDLAEDVLSLRTQESVGPSGDQPEAVPRQESLHPAQAFFGHRPQEGQVRGPRYHFRESGQRGGASSARRSSNDRLSPRLQGNAFGIIKDISVTNIVASDLDKTKGFSDKDFSQVFMKKNICDSDIEAVVFEPRPSPSLPRPLPRWQLSQPPRDWSAPPGHYTFNSGEDPWLRHSPDVTTEGRRSHGDYRSSHSPDVTTEGRRSPRTDGAPTPAARLTTRPSTSTSSKQNTGNKPPITYTPGLTPKVPTPASRHPPPIPSSRAEPNPQESLDHALQNLNDLTKNLTREDSIDSVDMVIDSKVLESLLQGAEGYVKPQEEDLQCPLVASETDTEEVERILESAPMVPTELGDPNQPSTPPQAESIPLMIHGSRTEAESDEKERDAVYV